MPRLRPAPFGICLSGASAPTHERSCYSITDPPTRSSGWRNVVRIDPTDPRRRAALPNRPERRYSLIASSSTDRRFTLLPVPRGMELHEYAFEVVAAVEREWSQLLGTEAR